MNQKEKSNARSVMRFIKAEVDRLVELHDLRRNVFASEGSIKIDDYNANRDEIHITEIYLSTVRVSHNGNWAEVVEVIIDGVGRRKTLLSQDELLKCASWIASCAVAMSAENHKIEMECSPVRIIKADDSVFVFGEWWSTKAIRLISSSLPRKKICLQKSKTI